MNKHRLFTVVTCLASAGVALAQAPPFEWARAIGGPADDVAWASASDADRNVYVVGEFRDTVDFDPGPGEFNLTSEGSNDAYVFKLNAAGQFEWAAAYGDESIYDRAFCVATDGFGNVYVGGSFDGTVDFDPGPGSFELTAELSDAFVVKLTSDGGFV